MGLQQPTMWDVYEYMKIRFMYTGDVPTRQEVFTQLPGVDPVEVDSGIIHFHEIIKGWPGHE